MLAPPPSTESPPPLDETALLRRLEPRAAHLLRRAGIPAHERDDLLQNALLLWLVRRDEIRDPEAWILQTLRLLCRNYCRSRARAIYNAIDTHVLESLATPTPATDEAYNVQSGVRTAMRNVPPRCRGLLATRYGLDASPADTALRHGYASSGIYQILHRCLAILTTHLVACGFRPPAE